MGKILHEGMISALFFLIAFVFLILNNFGILTISGLALSIIAICFSIKGKYLYPACIGIITSVGSFFAQYITAFCPYCTISATAFLVGGLFSLMLLESKNIYLYFGLVAMSFLAVFLLLTNLPQYEQRPIVVANDQKIILKENKALLYISPECKSCKTTIEKFITFDPEGEYWQPVVIPAISLAQGEAILRDKGYSGEVKSGFSSPARFVPLLEINGQYYRGKQITTDILKEVDS